jgi:hypothetical protein
MLFEVTYPSPAGAGSDQAVVSLDLSALTDLGNAVQMETRHGRRIWQA